MDRGIIINAGGSGGASLNYKVVGGTTTPETPANNTIWVNTDTPISRHIFSATQPENPVEGMVWFVVGTSSSAPINLLKKGNAAYIYPASCQQYIGGAWVAKEATTYQTSKWVEWATFFYSYGDLYEDVTGGFTAVKNDSGAVTFNADNIYLNAPANDSKRNRASVRSANKIDFTKYKTLYFELAVNVSGNDEATIAWGLASAVASNAIPTFIASGSTKESLGKQAVSVDVSAVSGEAYIAATFQAYWEKAYGDMTIYKVWGE